MKARVGLRLLLVAALAAAVLGTGSAATAGDPGTGPTLFNLTNQDRTSNGLGALGSNSNLSGIATSARGSCGGVGINGRSEDLIERNYFAHQIPPCGLYVWQVFNLGAFTSAGENIGWNNYPPAQSVQQINTAFMNSPEHRANILGNYNQMGTGVWAATGAWTGAGGSYNGVIMYTEIFINAPGGGAPPPPPPPPPPPVRQPVQAAPVVATPTQPAPVENTPAPAPSPSPTPPSCPVPTDIGEADRTSPAPTLPSDGGPAPCPSPNLVGPVPSAAPSAVTVTGSIDGASDVLTVSSAQGMAVGDIVTIAGAGPDGGDLVARVSRVDGRRLVLDVSAATSVKDATVGVRQGSEVQGADREASRRGILETVVDQVLRLFLNV